MERAAAPSSTLDPPAAHSDEGQRRLLIVATEPVSGKALREEVRRHLGAGAAQVRVVAPISESTQLRHILGDVDRSMAQARRRLRRSLDQLKAAGIDASGEVGDADPILAAEDALRTYPADEILILNHPAEQAEWFEAGIFERAREYLEPEITLVTVQRKPGGEAAVVGTDRAGRGTEPTGDVDSEITLSPNLPPFGAGDLLGIVVAVLGTVLIAVLASNGEGVRRFAGAAQLLIAMGIALINLAHVVGLVLFQSVRYRGGWQSFFRWLSLIGTPAAIVIVLLL